MDMIKEFKLQEIIKYEDFPFCIQKSKLFSDFSIHKHNFSELVVIIGGTAKHIINDDEYLVKPGDVYVVSGDISHGFKDVNELELCNIIYDCEKLTEYGTDIKEIPGFQALFVLEPYYRKEHQFKSKLQLKEESQRYVKNLINIIFEEYETKMDGFKSIITAYFITLIVFLSREYTSSKNISTKGLLDLAETIVYIERHYFEPIELNKLSSMANISVRHFCRIFKKNYNTTPTEYIIKLRLEHACSLLKNTNNSITEVAIKSGFSDSNYFSRQFKKIYGMSPSDFCKRLHD